MGCGPSKPLRKQKTGVSSTRKTEKGHDAQHKSTSPSSTRAEAASTKKEDTTTKQTGLTAQKGNSPSKGTTALATKTHDPWGSLNITNIAPSKPTAAPKTLSGGSTTSAGNAQRLMTVAPRTARRSGGSGVSTASRGYQTTGVGWSYGGGSFSCTPGSVTGYGGGESGFSGSCGGGFGGVSGI